MEYSRLGMFRYIFFSLCVLGTIALGIECVRKYLADEDVSKSSHKRFHSSNPDTIYPSITLCIVNPFLEHQLKQYGKGINVTSYSNFLRGIYWDDRMLKIDYDRVTISLTNNLILISQNLHNKGNFEYHHMNKIQDPDGWMPHFYVSYRNSDRKCFTINIPYIEQALINLFEIYIRNEFYPKGLRPLYRVNNGSNPDDWSGLLVYFHFPGQRQTSYYSSTSEWNTQNGGSKPYVMTFDLKDVNVIKHRNKPREPCIEDWKNFDELFFDEIMVRAGCRPPHWSTKNNLLLCSTEQKMKEFGYALRTTEWQSFHPPCYVIHNLEVAYHETQSFKKLNDACRYFNYDERNIPILSTNDINLQILIKPVSYHKNCIFNPF